MISLVRSCFFLLTLWGFVASDYAPTWDSLDTRPLPSWYDESKIGIFLHWGVFSVPSFGSEWFWAYWKGNTKEYVEFMNKSYRPDFGYTDFGSLFTAEFYDPQKWADIFQASGAKWVVKKLTHSRREVILKAISRSERQRLLTGEIFRRYVVLTSKHHEGFTLWPSKVAWNWNAMDVGPKRDLLGDLADAVRNNTDLHFGVYHSLYDWFHPLYLLDKKNSYKTNYFVHGKTIPELKELVNIYKPEVIWSDGDWEAQDTYWQSKEFLAWLYNESPVKDKIVVNDRWGSGIPCKHGGFYTCTDRYNPKTLQNHKWENAMTLDHKSWGFRRDAVLSDFLTIEELITQLAETVSCGGNLLINVGPTHDGRIVPIFEERLRQLGSWLKVNGDAIYKTSPWKAQNDTLTPGVWYTSKGNSVYAIVLNWPKSNVLSLGSLPIDDSEELYMVGVSMPLKHKKSGNMIQVQFPLLTPDLVPCNWAWVLKVPNFNRSK